MHHIKIADDYQTAKVTERVGRPSLWTVRERLGRTLVLGQKGNKRRVYQIQEWLAPEECRATLVVDM